MPVPIPDINTNFHASSHINELYSVTLPVLLSISLYLFIILKINGYNKQYKTVTVKQLLNLKRLTRQPFHIADRYAP